MSFEDIKGQALAKDYLRRSVVQSRTAHALLFTGPEGVGKRTAALCLAQALNCLEARQGEPCGRCVSCRKIAAGIHPDVRVIEADGQHLKIDQIRERLQQDAYLKPVEGRRKVYILDPADTLTAGAAGSLLKILEEPPSAVAIVLITSQPFALLDTIRSRCQEVRFYPLPPSELADWLQARLACSAETAKTLAMLSAGRPAEALRLQEADSQELRRQVLDLAGQIGPKNWPELSRQLNDYSAELPEVLSLMLTWYRDLFILASGSSPDLVVNVDRQAALKKAGCRETPETLAGKCRAILTAADQLSRNVNVQMLLEVMLMNLGRQAA